MNPIKSAHLAKKWLVGGEITYKSPLREDGKRDLWYIRFSDFGWEWIADGYDGAPDANDHRCGMSHSVKGAFQAIKDWYEENEDA